MYILISSILGIILISIFNRLSHVPANLEEGSGKFILSFGYGHLVIALIIGIQIPITIIYAMYPIIEAFDVLSILYIVIMCTCFFIGLKEFVTFFRYKIEVTEETIVEIRTFMKPQVIEWKNIKNVSYSNRMLYIFGIKGQKMCIKIWINGIHSLLDEIKARLPESATNRIFEQLTKL